VRRKLAPFAFAIALALVGVRAGAAEHRYRETTGNVSTEYTSEITRDAATGNVEILSRYPATGETHRIVFGVEGGAVSWTYRYPDGTVTRITRTGNVIECAKDGARSPAARSTVDGAPWFASVNYGLSELARAPSGDREFWIVNPENGKPYKMRAHTVGEEIVSVDGTPTNAVRIRITAWGLPAAFFSMDYWYRKSDFVFVKSVGSEDGPGSPKTTVELVG